MVEGSPVSNNNPETNPEAKFENDPELQWPVHCLVYSEDCPPGCPIRKGESKEEWDCALIEGNE